MKQNKLDCCVVRDLLPSYIEDLTEPETSRQVAEHLEDCADCRTREQQMRAQLPIQPVSKKSLRFLKRARHNRILSALCAVLLALLIITLWFFYLYPYANTEKGRLKAVQDYIVCGDSSNADAVNMYGKPIHYIPKGTPVQVISYTEVDNSLFISFAAQDDTNSVGILELVRGINGRYRLADALWGTGSKVFCRGWSTYDAWTNGNLYRYYLVLAGFDCKDVDSMRITYSYDFIEEPTKYPSVQNFTTHTEEYQKTYPITDTTFLWAWDDAQLVSDLGIANYDESSSISIAGTPVLLDKAGNDVTDQYIGTTDSNWFNIEDETDLRYIYIFMFGIFVFGILAALQILEDK